MNGEAAIGKCAAGGNECAQAMSAIMGIKAEVVARKVALVKCSGQKTYNEVGEQIGAKYVCKDGPVFRCDEIDELPDEY